MPEGDTLHHAAKRVGAALVGNEILSIETPHPRHRMDRWPERLAGRGVRRVDARGKHLFVRFDGDLTLHSHLRMTGKWGVYRSGQRWTRSPRRAWLVVRTAEHEVVQFDGPVLELMTDSRTRFDLRLAALGPDIVAEDFDEAAALRRLREDDPTRGIGDALLDQRIVAGIGNLWKSEACFLAEVDPWRPSGRGQRRGGARDPARRAPAHAALGAGRLPGARAAGLRAHGPPLPPLRHARPLPRAGRRQPHHLLVPRVPVVKRIGHKGADHVAPGNTLASFEAALEHGVDMIEFDVLRMRDGALVLAHDLTDAASREPLTLDEGLDIFAGEAYADVELDVDMKIPGYEREVVDGLRRRDLTARSMVSTMYRDSLALVGELDPEVKRGWSYPNVRRDYTRTVFAPAALPLLKYLKARLPERAARMIRDGRCEALMSHFRLVTPRLARAVREAGGELYVWTVDDGDHIRRLEALGVAGVISNDPRLFEDPVPT